MAINLENVLSSIGTIEELNNIQNYFNTVCENCRTKLIVESKAKELSSSPLLYLMEAFSSLSPELLPLSRDEPLYVNISTNAGKTMQLRLFIPYMKLLKKPIKTPPIILCLMK